MSTLLNAAVAVRLASTSDEAAQASAMAYWRALRTLTEHRELFYKVREVLITLSHLLPALNGRNDVQHALHVAGSIAAEGRSALTKTIPQLAFVPCPFPEIAEGTSMKDYLLLPPAVGAHPVLDHFRTAGRFVERFDESLQRIVGWLLTGDDTT